MIKFQNPVWESKLKKLTKRVSEGLVCHSEVEAKLYKLLIYKTGCLFKNGNNRYPDMEKEKNMFGTLIIQLPSIHSGIRKLLKLSK